MSSIGESYCDRLYEEHRLRAQRLAAKAAAQKCREELEQKERLSRHQPRPGFDAGELTRRLYETEVKKRAKKQEKRRAAEAREAAELDRQTKLKREQARSGTCQRLFEDSKKKSQAMEVRREQRDQQESERLLAESVHGGRRSDGQVFARLYEQGRKDREKMEEARARAARAEEEELRARMIGAQVSTSASSVVERLCRAKGDRGERRGVAAGAQPKPPVREQPPAAASEPRRAVAVHGDLAQSPEAHTVEECLQQTEAKGSNPGFVVDFPDRRRDDTLDISKDPSTTPAYMEPEGTLDDAHAHGAFDADQCGAGAVLAHDCMHDAANEEFEQAGVEGANQELDEEDKLEDLLGSEECW
mmetsp:Transcript_7583/g.21509  ORF Transcript_7583/g.21509 Transcript_7583/m.21509 type:complete len:359 (+) Transcript_7583:219-1295(+)